MKWYKYNGFINYGCVERDRWTPGITSHCLNGEACDKFEWKYIWIPDNVIDQGQQAIKNYITFNADTLYNNHLLRYGEVEVDNIEETEDVPVEVIEKEYIKCSDELSKIMKKSNELMAMKIKMMNKDNNVRQDKVIKDLNSMTSKE